MSLGRKTNQLSCEIPKIKKWEMNAFNDDCGEVRCILLNELLFFIVSEWIEPKESLRLYLLAVNWVRWGELTCKAHNLIFFELLDRLSERITSADSPHSPNPTECDSFRKLRELKREQERYLERESKTEWNVKSHSNIHSVKFVQNTNISVDYVIVIVLPEVEAFILDRMEVFQTENYYIFVKKEKSLWWHRVTSEFTLKTG